MKTITHNGKKVTLYADQVHAMRICKESGFAAKRGEFDIGTRKWPRYVLPRTEEAMEALGLREVHKEYAKTQKEKEFFEKHPRCWSGIFGNAKRINAILKKV